MAGGSFGHSGRVDSSGCHRSAASGRQHCHQKSSPDQSIGTLSKVKVIDGDTIRGTWNSKEYKVRLAEIDAPELDQPWGLKASKALSERIEGRTVRLSVIDRDRYGRLVAKLYLGDEDICMEMIRAGHAWAYRQYLEDDGLIEVEDQARVQGVGFWSDKEFEPIPPWDWRRGKR